MAGQSDFYSVGVNMMMTGNLPGELGRIEQLIGNISSKIVDATGKLTALGKAASGILAGGVAFGIMHELDTIAKHGDKLLDQQSKLLRTGVERKEIAELTAKAYGEISKAVPTATGSDAPTT